MKTLIKSILFIIVFGIILFIGNNAYAAASTTISPSSTSVTTGTNVNISVGVNSAESWNLKLTCSGGTLGGTTNVADAGDGEVTQNVMNATFSATTAGTYTIYLKGTIASSTDVTNKTPQTVDKSITITVTAPAQPTSTPKPSTQPTTQPTTSPVELTFTPKNETVYVTSDVNVRNNYGTTSSKVIGQLKKGESIVRTGVSNEKADGNYWSKVTYNGQTAYIASGFLSVDPPDVTSPKPSATPNSSASPEVKDNRSHDSSLKELSVKGVTLSPTFNSTITSYSASVKADVESVQVTAKVNDAKAKVEITGDKNLKMGDNIVTVAVTAEDETKTEYKIKVTKGAEKIPMNALVLTGIRENGQKIAITIENPEISENKVTYNVNIKEKIKSVELIGTLDTTKYTYEGLGIFEVKNGDNEYKITIKQAGAADVEYILKVNYSLDQAATNQSGSKVDFKVIAIVAVVVVAAIASIFAYIRFKGKGNSDFGGGDYSFLKNDPPKGDDDIYKFDYNSDNSNNYDNSDNDMSGRKSGKHF